MWLITRIGFFSIVEKPYDRPKGTLTIRARSEDDLENLRGFLPSMSAIAEDKNADYHYRATANRAAVSSALAKLINDLDYSNFKDEVYRVQGPEREAIYSEVWSNLRQLQDESN